MAVSLLKRTRETLRDEGNIRLRKIASNDKTVMSHFSKEDIGKDLKDLDIDDDSLPLQHKAILRSLMFPSSRNVSRVRFNKLTAMSAVGNDVSASST
jgi:hypothetical protein